MAYAAVCIAKRHCAPWAMSVFPVLIHDHHRLLTQGLAKSWQTTGMHSPLAGTDLYSFGHMRVRALLGGELFDPAFRRAPLAT